MVILSQRTNSEAGIMEEGWGLRASYVLSIKPSYVCHRMFNINRRYFGFACYDDFLRAWKAASIYSKIFEYFNSSRWDYGKCSSMRTCICVRKNGISFGVGFGVLCADPGGEHRIVSTGSNPVDAETSGKVDFVYRFRFIVLLLSWLLRDGVLSRGFNGNKIVRYIFL